jgi:nucleotide-binding universal stress UspA family protein
MKTILVPIDFSTTSTKAVGYVENVFRNEDVTLELIYVSTTVRHLAENEIHESFKAFEKENLKKYELPYTFTVLSGDNLLEQIRRRCEEVHPFLVVMGTNRTQLAQSLVKLTQSPVLIIPENSDKSAIRKIAYANDFNSIKASSALEPLLNLSRAFGAKVHIIHVCKDEVLSNDEAEASIEYYLDHVDHEYVSMKSSDFVKTIQEYLKNQDIDLLTILIRDHGNNTLDTQGQLIEQLVANARVPVLSLV